jgi:hypothetical protein
MGYECAFVLGVNKPRSNHSFDTIYPADNKTFEVKMTLNFAAATRTAVPILLPASHGGFEIVKCTDGPNTAGQVVAAVVVVVVAVAGYS